MAVMLTQEQASRLKRSLAWYFSQHCKKCGCEAITIEAPSIDWDEYGRIVREACVCGGVVENGPLPDPGYVNIALDGDYNFVSQSLAINPNQAAEHRATFPGVELTPDGCPAFNSVKQREQYMDACGVYKP